MKKSTQDMLLAEFNKALETAKNQHSTLSQQINATEELIEVLKNTQIKGE